VLVQVFLAPRYPGPYNLYADWAHVLFFAIFLLLGFALARDPELEATAHAERWRAFGLAVAAALLLLGAVAGLVTWPPLVLGATAVAGWGFVVGLLGLARARVRGGLRLRALARIAFPVYLLHQPVIVVLGAGIVGLPLGVAAKFTLLLAASSAGTLGLIATLRYVAPLRPLLGLPAPRRATAPDAGGAGMSRGRWPHGVLLGLAAATALAGRAADLPAPIEGLWWADGGSAQVEIHPCDGRLCGRVVWLRRPFDDEGCMVRDDENPDPALRDRPVVGLRILRGLRAAGKDRFDGGTIYDPGSGHTFSVRAQLEGRDRLRVRGYLGLSLLGRTTTWVRVGSTDACREPEP
jgi:uncharacterized protein (DUF2147 family)